MILYTDSPETVREDDGFVAYNSSGHRFDHSVSFGDEVCDGCGHKFGNGSTDLHVDLMIKRNHPTALVYCFDCITFTKYAVLLEKYHD